MDAEAFRYVRDNHFCGMPSILNERMTVVPIIITYLGIALAESRQAIECGRSPAEFNLCCFRAGLHLFEPVIHKPHTPELFKAHISLYRTYTHAFGEPAAQAANSFAEMRSQLARAYFSTRNPLLKKYTYIDQPYPTYLTTN